MKFYSQAGQDKWVCEFFEYKQNGFFIEVGAYDGIQSSNTYALEKYLNWSGICIEANPDDFLRLENSRSSKNYNIAVSSYKGQCNFANGQITYGDTQGRIINCDKLDSILEKAKCNKEIDYLSIDIEGEEYNVLQSFDFSQWTIKLMTVEHNLYLNGPEQKNKLYNLLTSKNFIRVVDNALCLDPNPEYYGKPYEDWYINKDYIK